MITAAEIIILIAGAVLFTVSFILPDKGSSSSGDMDMYVDEDAIKDIVDEEVKKAKESIDEAAKLSISDSKDKLERYMDRLTNEKMMAVGEYSDTVIEQIHKDHQEAVFLYDMIDNKHSQVKNTAAELGQLQKDVKRLSESISTATVAAESTVTEPVEKKRSSGKSGSSSKKNTVLEEPVIMEEEPVTFDSLMPEVIEATDEVSIVADADRIVSEPAVQTVPEETVSTAAAEAFEPVAAAPDGVELMFDSDSNSMNNNDRILALHKEGKSNMAIAKELGLGVGEVKLVIDLFKS